ncbi:response regulator [Labilibacter sediminis]|nr:response regulator [Labilibacter sediminis]
MKSIYTYSHLTNVTLLIVLLFSTSSFTQTTNKYFSSLRYENGLPSNLTTSIIQDNAGFIWIGTDEGLCRYDGHSMLYFTKDNSSSSLPSERISALLLDGEKIWVGTWDKLCTIDTKTFQVEHINTGELNAFRALYKDKKGNIWIGTNNGLMHFDKIKNQYRFYHTGNCKISHNTIRSFCEDHSGNLWIGTLDGINRFSNGYFTSFDLKGDYKSEIKNNLILSIKNHANSDSLLWVGTETGLCLLNIYTGQYKNYNANNTNISNEVIKSIYVSENNLWLGTDYGLNILNIDTKQINTFYHNPNINHSICNNVIWEIFSDNNHLLWFITSNGLSILDYKTSPFSLHEVLYDMTGQKAGNLIRDILVLEDGSKWLATIHGVVNEFPDGTQRTFTSNSPPNERLLIDNVYALEIDKLGRIWIGTAGGINIWDPQIRKMYSITADTNNGLKSNYISSFTISPTGDIWLSAWEGGLFQIKGDLNKLEHIRFIQITDDGAALSTFVNNQLYYTSKNNLWSFDPVTSNIKIVATTPIDKSIHHIQALKNDKENRVWMARRDGLWHYDCNSDNLIHHPFTIPVSHIKGMELDSLGYIWISTHNSVHKFDTIGQHQLTIPLNTNTPIKNFLSNSSMFSPNGRLFLGGTNGYVEIDPNFTYSTNEKPSIVISGIDINNQALKTGNNQDILLNDIPYTSNLHLSHDNNSLTFRFSNLEYWLPQKSIFKYRLLGFDQQWQYTDGQQNFAIYSNLKPGKYKFEVIGTNYMGLSSQKRAGITIDIAPPIWLSKIFFLLYFILTVGILYLIFYIFNYRNRLNNQLQITQLEKDHSEQLFNAKQQFFTNVSHEFRTPLSLIVPPIKQVLKTGKIDDNSRRMLTLANKNSHRLLSLINQILDFRKLENTDLSIQKSHTNINALCHTVFDSFSDMANRNEINYEFVESRKHYTLNIDTQKIETILFNLLSNAFKYTPINGSISLTIKELHHHLQIKIKDTGEGISKEESSQIFKRFYQGSQNKTNITGSGIGLPLSLEYARLHNGTIKVDSQLEKGSCFTLLLPINDDNHKLSDNKEFTGTQTQSKQRKESVTKESFNYSDRKCILIVDDNPDILEFIELNLSDQYNIIKAINGVDGLQEAKQHIPQLIISDVMMPEMDGFSMCEKLKVNEKTMHIPVILLTAKNLDNQKIKGMKSGADMYITKPFEIEYLQTCIENLFRREQYLLQYTKNLLTISPKEDIHSENNQDTTFLKKVMNSIELNINNSAFSVEVLSDELGLSTTHLYRKLKKLTGLSTQEIIKNYRLQKAAMMLQNVEGNITEIMYAVGFTSLSNFSKSFKSQFGVSPSEYIKTLKK